MKIPYMILTSFMLLMSAVCSSAGSNVKPVLIGIYVLNYQESVSWYRDNFGFNLTKEIVNDEANLRIIFLDNGEFELEIYADIVSDPNAARLDRSRFGMPGEGFVKLSLDTEDLKHLAVELSDNGVDFVREIKQSDRKPNQSWFMVKDPDGNLIQIFGPTPEIH